MTRAVAVTFAPSGVGARCRKSNSTPTLRSSVSKNGAMAWRAVRSRMPIRLGVLNTAGIPSVANSMQCFASTTNVVSPVVPIFGADFILICALAPLDCTLDFHLLIRMHICHRAGKRVCDGGNHSCQMSRKDLLP